LEQCQAAITSLKEIVDIQRTEIERWTKERVRLAELRERQSQRGLSLEALLEVNSRKVREFELQAKRFEKENRENASFLLTQISNRLLPKILDPSRFNFAEILQDQDFPASERGYKVFDLIIKHLNQSIRTASISVDYMNELRQKVITEEEKNKQLLTVLCPLFHSFQACLSDPKSNSDLRLGNGVQLDSLLTENGFIAPESISMDLLFNGSVEDRKQVLQQVFSAGWHATFGLFCAQILTNVSQRHAIDELTRTFDNQRVSLEQVGKADAVRQGITKSTQSLRSRNKKLKAQLKAQEVADAEDQQTIKALETKHESHRGNLQALIADATSLRREINVKTQQIVCLE
jgi:hypothetical protein